MTNTPKYSEEEIREAILKWDGDPDSVIAELNRPKVEFTESEVVCAPLRMPPYCRAKNTDPKARTVRKLHYPTEMSAEIRGAVKALQRIAQDDLDNHAYANDDFQRSYEEARDIASTALAAFLAAHGEK